jgi:DNA repair photolyase
MHLLTPGRGRTAYFDYTLNPYRGCSFGCTYCFAAFFVPDPVQREDWGKWVEVKVRAADALRRADLRGKRIFMSSVTDPYQPLEAEVELTRELVGIMADQGVHLVVQTRSPLAARDIDLFCRFENIRVNMTVATDDDTIRKQFEPACASIERRLDAVARLRSAGIPVAISCSPLLPMDDPEAFGRRLASMGVCEIYSAYFHRSDRDFASNTRDEAWQIAARLNWTEREFQRTRDALLAGFGRRSEPIAFAA